MYCKRLRALLLIAPIIMFSSCTIKQEEETNLLKAINVFLPLQEMEHLVSFAEAKMDMDTIPAKLSFVVYKDPQTCTTCEMSHLGEWGTIERKSNEIIPVKYFYIFAPSEDHHHEIESFYQSSRLLQSIYIDDKLAFEKSNPILKNVKYHSFLMDAEGKLLFVGDPTKSESNEKNLLKVLQVYAERSQGPH